MAQNTAFFTFRSWGSGTSITVMKEAEPTMISSPRMLPDRPPAS